MTSLVFTNEHRYFRSPDGAVWTEGAFPRSFWSKYLETFDSLRVVARVERVSEVQAGWVRSDGDEVAFRDLPSYRGIGGALKAVREIAAATRTGEDELLLLRAPGAVATLAWPWALRRGVPFGVELVGDPAEVFARNVTGIRHAPLLRPFAVAAVRAQVKTATAVSYVTERALQGRYPARANAARGTYSAVALSDSDFLPPSSRRPSSMHIVTVGSLEVKYKGIDYLIRALAECRRLGSSTRLTVVGDGAQRPHLAALADELGVAADVVFVGWVPSGSGVREYLDDATLFVLPSLTEGLPSALLEAMARSLPCIGTRVGGVSELLNDGWLVEPRNVSDLARMIASRLADPESLNGAAEENYSRARAFHESALSVQRASFFCQWNTKVTS